MKQHEQLNTIKEKLLLEEDDSPSRKVKEKTLFYLMVVCDNSTGELPNEISIPKYEVDKDYLTEVLNQLGYEPEYKGEDYDGYFEGTCYQIAL